MTNLELNELVENIVARVLQRIESDAELQHLLQRRDADDASATPASADSVSAELAGEQALAKKLFTERDILDFSRTRQNTLVAAKSAIFTPSALDAARAKHIKIIRK